MNKVITINLNGVAYQLEEDGYEALRTYLGIAASSLGGNPDKDEIIADIEQSIADKFRGVLGANKTVVVTKEVQDVIAEMGPVQDASSGSGEPAKATGQDASSASGAKGPAAPPVPEETATAPKRLFRLREGAKIGGVCNGLAAYLGIDVTLVRIVFAVVGLTFGAGLLVYLALMVIIPWAKTPAEIDAAHGDPSTAEDFIRRAKAGYYDGMKSFGNKREYREWTWRFKQEMRQHKRDFRSAMRRNGEQWSREWHAHWGPNPQHHPGWWIANPFISVLLFFVTILGVASILSLILTGSILGVMLPAGIPLWLGILIVFVIYRAIKSPLKAMRHGYYFNGCGPGFFGPLAHLLHSVFWLALLVLTIWFADRHSSAFHEALMRGRHEAHHVVTTMRNWWNSQ